MRETQPSKRKVPASGTRSLEAVLFALLVAAFAGSAPTPVPQAPNSLRTRLAAAVGALRFAEGRLSGGFRYAPYRGVPETRDLRHLAGILRAIEATSARHPSPQTDVDRAVIDLIMHRPAMAVRRLEISDGSPGDGGSSATDLSAAYLELATVESDPYDLFKALAAADLALAAPSPPIEAWFDRAVALERLAPSLALPAWTAYLAHDDLSQWAGEARMRRSRLSTLQAAPAWGQIRTALLAAAAVEDSPRLLRFCGPHRQLARQLVENELLPQWARYAHTGQAAEALLPLAAAKRIASKLAPLTGDSMLMDTIEAIESAALCRALNCRALTERARATPNPPHECQQCAGAILEFDQALRLYQARRFGAARQLLAIAEHRLRATGIPLFRWATFYLAVCDYQVSAYRDARSLLARLEHLRGVRRYPILLGKIYWLEGLIASVNGRLTESLSRYQAAAASFAAAGEEENHAVMLCLLAENYSSLGDRRNAWRCRIRPLALLARFQDPIHRLMVLQEVVLAMTSARAPLTALAFQDEAVANARALAQPDAYALALRRRADLRARLGRLDAARRDLDLASLQARRAADPEIQRTLRGEILAIEGAIALGASRPQNAVEALTAALAIYNGAHYTIDLPTLYLQRSRAVASLGRHAEVESDLLAAIRFLDEQGRSMGTSTLRSQFLDQGRQIFDEAIRFYAREGRAGSALEVAERGRARLLLALNDSRIGKDVWPSNGETESMTAAEMVERLPADAVLLEYAVLDDRLITWSITRRGVKMLPSRLSRPDLASVVHRFVAGARAASPSAAFEEDARRAHDLLIAPWSAELAGKKVLIVIPDQELYRVPFGALLDRKAGTPLLAQISIGVAPSAALYLRARARCLSLAGHDHPPLATILGNPAAASPRLAGLAPAAATQDEAIAVASLYPGARLLLGSAATRPAFLAAAKDADLVHLAAHALVSDEALESYGVVFAGQTEAMPPLRVEDLDLRRAVLVYLSACGTARGFLSPSEGALSPARLVLAAGVPVVVASLWNVDDTKASRLAISFHRHLRAGAGVLESLRAAELDLRQRGEPPSIWAAFEVLGGAV